VLLLHERIDEWLVTHLDAFDGKPLQSVAKGKLELGGDEAEQRRQAEDEYGEVLKRVKAVLGDRVQEVRLSSRLVDSPSCLVVDESAMSPHLERLLKQAGQPIAGSRPHLELNPGHPIVERLKRELEGERFADWSHLLFEQAVLAEGGQLEAPADFVKRLNTLLLALAGEA